MFDVCAEISKRRNQMRNVFVVSVANEIEIQLADDVANTHQFHFYFFAFCTFSCKSIRATDSFRNEPLQQSKIMQKPKRGSYWMLSHATNILLIFFIAPKPIIIIGLFLIGCVVSERWRRKKKNNQSLHEKHFRLDLTGKRSATNTHELEHSYRVQQTAI